VRNLTVPNPDLEKFESKTVDGMAFWAGSGPPGSTCGKCLNYGYEYRKENGDTANRPSGCALYWKQMHKHGARAIPKSTAGCKYFETLTVGG
jgi:hypothetical protein